MITKDELASWDPDIKRIDVENQQGKKLLVLTLAYNSSTLTFTQDELERLMKELE